MDKANLNELVCTNLLRTQYLLRQYPVFLAQQSDNLDLQISKAVLSILSYSLSSKEAFTSEDCALIDRCGALLAPSIYAAANVIKSFPISISSVIYPVLFNQYLHNDGTAVSTEQLCLRLTSENIFMKDEEIQTYLHDGERMMSSIIFNNKFVSAMQACL